jgi:hypothetical protein
MTCDQLGAIQTTGTCWFFSILNGFILSEDGQKILYVRLNEFYNKLKPGEKTYFDDTINAPCPMKDFKKTNEIYFWKFVDQYLCFMSGPRTESLRMGRSAKVLAGMNLQGTDTRASMGTKGGSPQIEIANILEHVGFKGKFDMRYADKKIAFDSRKNPQFVVVRDCDWIPTAYMEKIPQAFMENKDYSLMCASIGIANTLANNREQHKSHAIAGYMCNGKGYIFDSNQIKVFRCDWWDLAELKRVVNNEISLFYPFFRDGQVNRFSYSFAIFSRKEFVKSVSPACLMKYKTKTPGGTSNFFQNHASGEKINNLFPQLKPAQRAALKRRWARTKKRNVAPPRSPSVSTSPNQRYSPKSPKLSPSPPKPKPKTPSPNQRYSPKSPKLSPSPPKPKPKTPSPNQGNQPLRNAKAHVNTLKTAVARKGYLKLRASNMSREHWKNLGTYIKAVNHEAQRARSAKRVAAGKVGASKL